MPIASFIELLLSKAAAEPPALDEAELTRMLLVAAQAMLAYVRATPLRAQPAGFAPRFMVSVELLLYACSAHA